MSEYLTEAFQNLNILNEDTFDVNADGLTELSTFVMDDDMKELETIIDPVAQTEEELQDSYIGKAILDCVICQSKIYKAPGEVIINEDESLANVGEVCPYCQSSDGYKIIGQVAEYCPGCEDEEVKVETDEEEIKVDVEPKDDEELIESMENVTIETEQETINVSAQPKEDVKGEMIAPLEPETEEIFETEGEEESEEEVEVEEPKFQDIELDEFEEEDFDELGEKYLRRVYENVKSYKTTSGSTRGNQIKLEGLITFKSGKQAKTNFVFEAKSVTKTGKLKFIGENKQFARGKKSFTLTGKADGKKLIAESLTYNYRARDIENNQSKRLYGTVVSSKLR